MRGLLLLSIVGVALYAILLFADNALRERQTEDAFGKAQPSHAADRTLRAWGRNLSALVIQQPEPPSQYSGGDSGADGELAASGESTEATVGYAEQEPVEWVEVVLAARAHSEASVSSPTIRFYSSGIELQIVRRQDGWVEVIDPATHERGWVFERYILSIEGPRSIQTAMDSRTEDKLSTPKSTSRALPNAKQRSRSAKPAVQAVDKFITKSEMRRARWAGRDDHRRRFGLFGRRFATFDAPW
jgi:hypothetical protein